MSSLFNDLKEGLQQAIDYEKGVGDAKTMTLRFSPAPEFNASQIRTIRTNAGMTQSMMADFMGVSNKTIEAWECGRTHPTGPASRLLGMLSEGQIAALPFVSIE